MTKMKRRTAAALLLAGLTGALAGCARPDTEEKSNSAQTEKQSMEQGLLQAWKYAETTPLGKYPELVTYTLGKVTAENNGNMPKGDTYEDNNYTRYLKQTLNVQNEDVIEGQGNTRYERLEIMAVSERELPDIMVVTSKEILDQLVEHDLIADLTQVYEHCTSSRIKEMYESYGDDKLGEVTYDGTLMAFPETEVYTGPALLWLRQDWIEDLGLSEPQSLEEALEVIQEFVRQNPGRNPAGNVGLVFDPTMVGQSDQCFSLDPIFDSYHAYPGKWHKDGNEEMVYGSVTGEMKAALKRLRQAYRDGILDQSFMLRNAQNLPELLQSGQCGAFFGWWWAPNNPLSAIYEKEADWQPYLFPDKDGKIETSLSYGRHYSVVARKDFAHPEIIPKILSALFDHARYDGKAGAEGVGEYLGTNVDPTVTPFVINLDYSSAIFRTTDSIKRVLDGNGRFADMTVLEQGYYNSCQGFLKAGKEPQAWQWAAYTSRITAVGKLAQADITYVNEGYTQEYSQLVSEELRRLEEEAFITIITGEKPLSYFDTFVKEWYRLGGEALTEEANRIAAAG